MLSIRIRPAAVTFAVILYLGLCAGGTRIFGQVPTPSVSPTPIAVPTPQPGNLPVEPPPVAPNFEAPIRPMPSPERVGVDLSNQLSLSLDQAIEMALKNNNNIDVARNNLQINQWNLKAARGVYDPLATSQDYYESATTPTASAIGGAVNGAVTQRRLQTTNTLSGFSPWQGGQYSAEFDNSRTTTSNTNSFLNPQFPSTLTFNYTQPLFRNRSIDQNRRQILIARKNVSITDSQFRQEAITTVSQVELAYWNLVFSLRNLQVQIDALKQARAQLESNQRLVERGVLAPIDIVQAQGQLATFEQNVYTAQETVTRNENTLKTLLLPDRTAAEWSRPITPVSPINLEAPHVPLEIATADALKNRPELEQFDLNMDINKIDERYYRNQTKPQIDLFGITTSQGLAGTLTPAGIARGTVPSVLVGGEPQSLANLLAYKFPTYRAGVTISLPIGNHVAKANLGRTLVEGDRLQNQRAQEEETIESEVRNAVQALRSAEARLNAAVAARAAAEEIYASEQRQFRAGTTTLFLVLQRQTELITARGNELQAQTALNQAISEFHRATGTTLTTNNIQVTPGAQVEKK